MTESHEKYVVTNCLKIAYDSLRVLGRFVQGSHLSPYKEFFEKLLDRKLDGEVPNSEVEAYYLNRLTESDFVNAAESRVFAGNYGDSDLIARLLSAVWDIELATPTRSSLCTGSNSESSRQLWEIFIRLDTESQLAVHIEDVCDLVLRIFKSNGHIEEPEMVQGWFNNQQTVQFWPFFEIMAENYKQYLQTPAVTELYTMISTEMIKDGKLSKKGHIVPNWKGRWFALTARSLTYREGKDTPILKTIVINEKSQVQNMPNTKGHLFRFRILDGVSTTPTEISATDEFTMREWMAFIRLAIKMHQIEGRNFLHKYRLAINSFPKSFFSQASAIPLFTAAPSLPQAKKSNTDPSHKGLRSSQSVPLASATYNGRSSEKTLPIIEQELDPTYDFADSALGNESPPIPHQQFDSECDMSPPGGHSHLRIKSSLDSSDIDHIQVDGDLEYAVVTKVIKKKKNISVPEMATNYAENPMPPAPPHRTSSPIISTKSKSMDAPLPPLPPTIAPHASTPPAIPLHTSTSAHPLANTPQLPPPRRSPPGISKNTPFLDITSSAPLSQSPHSSPTPQRKGYAELQFENGNLNTSKTSPIPERRHQPDVPNKFSYSKLQFEGDKEKEKELESGEVSKKGKKPPPPPRYQGNMMKNLTESNLQKAENRGRSKPTSLPDIKAGQQNLDYAEVVFSNKTAVSPLVSRRILGAPSDDPPPGNQMTPTSVGTVEYATVILTPKVEVRTTKNDKDKPRPDGYENFDFNPILQKEKDSGYANFDFSPSPSAGRDSSNLTQGPTVVGSARLIRPDHPQPKPQPKPRASPRKAISAEDKGPVPPARKTNGSLANTDSY